MHDAHPCPTRRCCRNKPVVCVSQCARCGSTIEIRTIRAYQDLNTRLVRELADRCCLL